MPDATFESLSVTHAAGVARIELQRPDSMNALSLVTGAELRDAVSQAGEDPAVRALLITGAGRGFSTGADLKDPNPGVTPEGRLDLGYNLREVFNPTILAPARDCPSSRSRRSTVPPSASAARSHWPVTSWSRAVRPIS